MKIKKPINFIVFFIMSLVLLSVLPVWADINDLPVIIEGSQLPFLNSIHPDQLYVLKYDASISFWESIPYQIDERFWIDLATCNNDPGLGNVDSHLTYDFNNTEGNGLDADDEVVFLVGDCSGDVAPPDNWPNNVGDIRYEIMVQDGSASALGHCYIFSAVSPPVPPSPINYVNYTFQKIDDVLENTTIETDKYVGHYRARWSFDTLRVLSPGGSGNDIIDRFKHRAYVQPNGTGSETEETWDLFSCFITRDAGPITDHKVGPVRAVREVQGAASGVNTTYTDYFYSGFFLKRVNLRLHPMGTGFISYVDYHQQVSPATYYNPGNPLGVLVDGAADNGINMALYNWEMLVNDTDGGLFWHRNEPIPVPAMQRTMFYWDDANFVDQTGDDEPGRYGAHGIWWNQVADTDTPGSEAIIDSTFVPLVANTGNIGQSLADEIENPPAAIVLQQERPIDCGDGVQDPGEECDEGAANGSTTCGCQADCTYTFTGTSCADGEFCNGDETCDGNGNCQAGTPPCDPATQTCNEGTDTCEPITTGIPGDCNDDGIVSAGDMTALVLENFDGDGNLPADAPGGTFPGDPVGCDANEDGIISAGDMTCIVLLVFNGPGACGGGAASASGEPLY